MTAAETTILIFVIVISMILLRPWKINESIPTTVGAVLMFTLGYLSIGDIRSVLNIVDGAGLTILATIIMSSILDKAGFFQLAAKRVLDKANFSGKRLFFLVLLLSFLMTMFFNNDGSILITTPIILEMTRRLQLSKANSLPYLLGSVLIASASSAPIGVSNLANLIALRIVGLNLNLYAALLFVPSMLGITVCAWLLYLVFRKNIPATYSFGPIGSGPIHGHLRPMGTLLPLHVGPKSTFQPGGQAPKIGSKGARLSPGADPLLMKVGLATVVAVRIGFFVGAAFNVPVELIAVAGAAVLLVFYFGRDPKGPWKILRAAPWHILVFAFGMYLLVYGLHNVGLTVVLGKVFIFLSKNTVFGSIIVTGILLTVMSSLMNNLPSIMIGTLMLTGLSLTPNVLHLSYLASVLGSDIGSLLLPVGTLASLLWFHIVSKRFPISWKDYMKVSFAVIPLSLVVSLVALYVWGKIIL